MDVIAGLANIVRRRPHVRGKSSVGWAVMRWLDRRGRLNGEWDITLADSGRFVLPRTSQMAWSVAFQGSYDSAPRAILERHIQPGTVVLDVGASLGLWTVPLALSARTSGAEVWAFEPHPNNHRWLHQNVALNGLGATVKVHETALGDEPGDVIMHSAEADVRGGNAAVALGADDVSGVSVPIMTLDSLRWTSRVSAIKIDVEGYEVRVLRGAAQLIARDRPAIFGEFNKIWLQLRGDDLAGLLGEMSDDGYDVFTIEQARSRPWRPHDVARLRKLARGEVAEDLLLVSR